MLLTLLAQAEAVPGPDDPDLTVPIVTIAVCLVLIVVTLVLQQVRSRRAHRTATPEELDRWMLDDGRLLDQWIEEVETEVQARRVAPDPSLVSRNDDPIGLSRAIDECPDARLAAVIAELRAAGAALLAAVRDGDPNGPTALGAESRFSAAKAQAGAAMAALRGPSVPQ
jgi:hypothetical protein